MSYVKIRKAAWAGLVLALALGCEAFDPTPGPQGPSGGGDGSGPAGPNGGGAFVPIGGGAVAPGGGSGNNGGGSGNNGGGRVAGGGNGGANAGDVSGGEALYFQYCAVCHGADASHGNVFPGSIQGATGTFAIITRGAGEMPPFPQLNADDVAAIEAFLASFLAVAGPNGVDGVGGADPGPLSPVEVYGRTCAGCHGAQGEGASRGPQVRSPVTGFANWVVRNGREGTGFRDPMPAYPGPDVSDDDLMNILAWLGDFPKPADGRGLHVRFCANCHGVDGRGGIVRKSMLGEGLGEALEIVREGHGGRNYGNRGSYMPAWSRAELSDADVRAIYQALAGASGGGAVGGEGDDDDDD